VRSERAAGGPLYLHNDVGLVAEADAIFLHREGVAVRHRLGVAEAMAVAFLAASGDRAQAAADLDRMLPAGGEWVDRIVARFWTFFGDGRPRALDMALLDKILAVRSPVPTLPQSSIRQEAAPAAVTWMVTLGCNRRCPYCFFAVFHHGAEEEASPPDATFPFADVVRMLQDMALIGAADLHLTGGEPLLRRDLPDIIAAASRLRVRTNLVTKYPIDRALARRLADAGLTRVTYSLDDARPGAAAALTGARDYLEEARTALAALREARHQVEVNAVLTSKNAAWLDDLARFLVDLGIDALRISPFTPPYPRRLCAERLVTDANVGALVRSLRSRFAGAIDISAGSGAVADAASERTCGGASVCEIGVRALDVLPDGSVTRCHYLPGVAQMTVGSLRESSLLDIWRGEKLRGLVRPTRAEYAETHCSGCGAFEACNSRGRCYVSALAGADTAFAPDDFCTASVAAASRQ
jgi:pyrroloquinoline quinone biosynthesis protein E